MKLPPVSILAALAVSVLTLTLIAPWVFGLLRSVGVLFLGFQSDDLSIGVVAPTICSLLLVS